MMGLLDVAMQGLDTEECFNDPFDDHISQCDEGSDSSYAEDLEDLDLDLSYSLKLVNPVKKSDYTIRKCRIKQKFTGVAQLTSKLMKNFKELHPMDDRGLSMGEPGHGYIGKQ